MPTLLDVAAEHQRRRDALAATAAARATKLFRRIDTQNLEEGWQVLAPTIAGAVAQAQVTAARQAIPYTNAAARVQGFDPNPANLIPEAFGGVTIDGRELAPELYGSVTTTKKLIGSGVAVPAAFRVGAQMMSLLAANVIRDMGRSADATIAVGKGFTYSVRVVNSGACSRCAILAGVKGYRTDFDRHPGCKCTSMPLRDEDTAPEGFYRSSDEYFESLSEAEQDRIFTRSGAEAIRLGADPSKVVNARRGMYRQARKRPDRTFAPSRLRPIQIGNSRDGKPLMVYATTEGTTARGAWGRGQNLDLRATADRYRRTSTLRLMPEQVMSMATSPERARELLARYGYLA